MNEEIEKTSVEIVSKKSAGAKLVITYSLVILIVTVIGLTSVFLSVEEIMLHTKTDVFFDDLRNNTGSIGIPILLFLSILSFLQGIFYYISGIKKSNLVTRKSGKILLIFSLAVFILAFGLLVIVNLFAPSFT